MHAHVRLNIPNLIRCVVVRNCTVWWFHSARSDHHDRKPV